MELSSQKSDGTMPCSVWVLPNTKQKKEIRDVDCQHWLLLAWIVTLSDQAQYSTDQTRPVQTRPVQYSAAQTSTNQTSTVQHRPVQSRVQN